MNVLRILAVTLLAGLASAVGATPADDAIRPIQERWAEIKYRLPEKQQAEQYHELSQQAQKLVEANPYMAEALVWAGIVVSSEAGARGGLGALSLAKESKRLLEESLKLDERALNGSAYTSLATLYAKAPGWPIAFGDDKRAEEMFRKALSLNPNGIDPNYFYGEYLIDNGRVAEGRAHLEAALKAPDRPGRELADQGRRREIQALLSKIAKENR
jgi:tetratricopeptide (TPR) repeat protein